MLRNGGGPYHWDGGASTGRDQRYFKRPKESQRGLEESMGLWRNLSNPHNWKAGKAGTWKYENEASMVFIDFHHCKWIGNLLFTGLVRFRCDVIFGGVDLDGDKRHEAASVDWSSSHRSLSLGFLCLVGSTYIASKIPPCGVFLMMPCRCMPCHGAEKQCLQTWTLDSTGGNSNLFWPEPQEWINRDSLEKQPTLGLDFFPSANFLFFIWCRTGHSSRLWHYQDWLCVGNLRWWMLTRLLPEWFLVWTLITTYIACSPYCRWSELSEMEAKESSNKKDDTSESPHHFVLRKQDPKS